jgi:hypothetical protein
MWPTRKSGAGGFFDNLNTGMILGGIARMSGDKNTAAFDQMAANFRKQREGQKRLQAMMADPEFMKLVPESVKGILPYLTPDAAARVVGQWQIAQANKDPLDAELKRARINSLTRSGATNPLDDELKRARINKLNRESETAGATGPYKSLKDKAGVAAGLRKEYTAISKEFRKVRDSWGRIEATQSNAAGDLALIFNYMKMLDPGSTVREGEFANAENSQGVGLRVRTLYNKLLKGERLAPEMREQFKAQARALYDKQKDQFIVTRRQFGGIAKEYGLDPDNVVPDFSNRGTNLPAGVTVREIK